MEKAGSIIRNRGGRRVVTPLPRTANDRPGLLIETGVGQDLTPADSSSEYEELSRRIADLRMRKGKPVTHKQVDKRLLALDDPVRLIAFYLPQFHPIPENDSWWGKDFTEWTNVKKGRPNFVGHYQPRLPGDLGFYDLRDPDIMERQASLCKTYGVQGWCFYYYWFAGKRLLDLPLNQMIANSRPDIPFCLCWANENWTKKWDGGDNAILIAQRHSDEDDKVVIMDLIRYMRHPNYIRINGKPLLLIYRIALFPHIARTVEQWRQICRAQEIGEIYLVMVESWEVMGPNPATFGFDASVEFPPHNMLFRPVAPPGWLLNAEFAGTILDYREGVLRSIGSQTANFVRFRTVMPSWDNTARRQNTPHIFVNSSPGAYQAWLETALAMTSEERRGDERIVFINAWNEWAEGAYLEPDQRYGYQFLEATLKAREKGSQNYCT